MALGAIMFNRCNSTNACIADLIDHDRMLDAYMHCQCYCTLVELSLMDARYDIAKQSFQLEMDTSFRCEDCLLV
jgi:hypothetical protein